VSAQKRCAYCGTAHTRNSVTCSESCARGYRRNEGGAKKMIRVDADERLEVLELHEKDRARRIFALMNLREANEKLLKTLMENNNGKN
jgi:hypothetical protein